MKITIAGTGYVGLSNAILLAQHNEVIALDINQEKVDLINQKKSPIVDTEIEDYLANKELNLIATTDNYLAYKDADYVIISTPTNYDPELNIPGLYNYDLEHFDFEEKSMYLRNLTNNEIIKLKWNPETQFYDKEILSEMHTQLESKLTDSDLTNLSKGVLRLMRNAIYARHGRTFNSYDLQRFFNNKTWYKPNPNYSDDLLTEIDKYNIELIQKYEAKQ